MLKRDSLRHMENRRKDLETQAGVQRRACWKQQVAIHKSFQSLHVSLEPRWNTYVFIHTSHLHHNLLSPDTRTKNLGAPKRMLIVSHEEHVFAVTWRPRRSLPLPGFRIYGDGLNWYSQPSSFHRSERSRGTKMTLFDSNGGALRPTLSL